MKNIGKIGRSLVLFSLAAFSACDSDPSSTGSITCGDPNLHLRKISFMLNGTLYDYDSLATFGSSTEISSGWFNSDYTIKFGAWGGDADHRLTIKFPTYATGIYSWGNRTIDCSGYGFQFDEDSLGAAKISYRSVHGSTNIKIYDNPGFDNDSLFGTFCGIAKDDAGNGVEVSDGRFYIGGH